jgi:serine/threonine protein kinase
MMVLEFAEGGDLRNYLERNKTLSWREKIRNIYNIALGLDKIHENGIMHRDLHVGNILIHNNQACITDMGPVSNIEQECSYGVVFYMAPEVIRNQGYTTAADIYSFGVLMYQIISGLPPYYDRINDTFLGAKICGGLRPQFIMEVPQLISDLKERCLDGDPSVKEANSRRN